MPNTEVMTISELSDIELDSVAAGRGRQVAVDNVAIQFVTVHTPLPSGCQLRGDAGQR